MPYLQLKYRGMCTVKNRGMIDMFHKNDGRNHQNQNHQGMCLGCE